MTPPTTTPEEPEAVRTALASENPVMCAVDDVSAGTRRNCRCDECSAYRTYEPWLLSQFRSVLALHAEVERLKEYVAFRERLQVQAAERNAELNAERDRLREGLDQALTMLENCDAAPYWNGGNSLDNEQYAARIAALREMVK